MGPFTVHCGKCSHERVLAYTPIPIDVFGALAKLPCISCKSKDVRMGPLPRATADGDVIGWLTNGDTGISSETIWSVLTGRRISRAHWRADIPQDPDDFGRCYRLLKIAPSWREHLSEVAAKYPEWTRLVEAWDELTALYEEELPSGRAPRLYARMRQLIDEARSVTK
jgi:hypothetical protein